MLGQKIGERGGNKELVDGQSPGPEAPPRSKKSQEGREQKNFRKRGTARGAMEKSWCVRVIEGEAIRGDDPVKYFVPFGVRSTCSVSKGVMAIEVLQIEEISDGGRKGVCSAIRQRGANRGNIHIKKKE